MKSVILLLSFPVLFFNHAIAQDNLDITINNIRGIEGNIMLQLLNETEKVVQQVIVPFTGNKCIVQLKNVEQGRYAIRYYHDENRNGKLDTNLIGKPVEGYGFSNNVIGRFGPPPFEKWLFDVKSDKVLQLNINY